MISLHTFKDSAVGASEIDIRHGVAVLSRDFEGQIANPGYGVFKKARARSVPAPRGPRKPPGPIQRPRCLGKSWSKHRLNLLQTLSKLGPNMV